MASERRSRTLISTGAAATVAGCHPTTIRRAIDRGELEAYRLGERGDRRLTMEALTRWLRPAHDPTEETRP